jgi:hypothetical protein
MTVSFVRAVLPTTGKLVCEGKIIHSGGRIATAEGRVTDAGGKLIAHSTETCPIIKAPRQAVFEWPARSEPAKKGGPVSILRCPSGPALMKLAALGSTPKADEKTSRLAGSKGAKTCRQ